MQTLDKLSESLGNHSEQSPCPAEQVSVPALLDQEALAKYLGKSTAWCERARHMGEGPPYLKLGRHVRYRVADVVTWMEGCQRGGAKK